MAVARWSSSTIELLCVGSRCWTMTKAKPLSDGTFRKNRSSAASPPAEAPIPTMGKRDCAARASSVSEGWLVSARRSSLFFSWRLSHGRTLSEVY